MTTHRLSRNILAASFAAAMTFGTAHSSPIKTPETPDRYDPNLDQASAQFLMKMTRERVQEEKMPPHQALSQVMAEASILLLDSQQPFIPQWRCALARTMKSMADINADIAILAQDIPSTRLSLQVITDSALIKKEYQCAEGPKPDKKQPPYPTPSQPSHHQQQEDLIIRKDLSSPPPMTL